MPNTSVLYFGCWSDPQAGRHLYRADGSKVASRADDAPLFLTSLLDQMLPAAPAEASARPEGVVNRTTLGGWTIVSFWDRSVDPSPASSTSFLVEGTHDIGPVLLAARLAYPQIFDRFRFGLTAEKLVPNIAGDLMPVRLDV